MLMNNFSTTKILKAYAANYPLLREYGYALSKPIALLGCEDDFEKQIKRLTNYKLKIINIPFKKHMDSLLYKTNMDFCGVIYPGGCVSKWKDKLRDFIMELHSELMDESPPLLVFADSRILNECREDFYIIYAGSLSEEEILLDEIVPKDEDLSLVMNMIDKTASNGSTQIERVLVASVCFMYPNLYANGKADVFGELVEYARFLAGQSEAEISEDVTEIFIEESYGWQRRNKAVNVFELPQIGMEATEKLDKAIFYNEEFIFISESLFKQIAYMLLQTYPESLLKFALVREGVLKPENTRTYTSKMNYRSIAGTYERVRMLRFQRSKFARCGDLDFLSLCLLRREMDGNSN